MLPCFVRIGAMMIFRIFAASTDGPWKAASAAMSFEMTVVPVSSARPATLRAIGMYIPRIGSALPDASTMWMSPPARSPMHAPSERSIAVAWRRMSGSTCARRSDSPTARATSATASPARCSRCDSA